MHEKELFIRNLLAKGFTLKQIGQALGGVSRQRVYQLMDRFNIETPEHKKKGYWKDKSPEAKWLQRTLCSRGVDADMRLKLQEAFANAFPTHCPILGIPLVYGNTQYRGEDSASLDQTSPGQGYTVENTNIVSWRANRIKNSGVLEDFIKIVAHLS